VDFLAATRFPVAPFSKETVIDAPAPAEVGQGKEELTDGILVTRMRICDRERDALGIFFQRYARLVHGIGRRILRDDAEAEDLVQEIFLYVSQKAELYDPTRGSVRTWLVQTSYYKALLRRARLRARNYDSWGDRQEGDELVEVADASLRPYDRSGEGLFGRDGWRELLASLTEDQWETIRLHFYEGHTFAEIAVRRNESVGNVRNHFYRGIERLRRLVKEHGVTRDRRE